MTVAPLCVLHISAARFDPADRSHATFEIWRRLASGFRKYVVLARSSTGKRSVLRERNLIVILIPSRIEAESEFLLSQFMAVGLIRRIDPDVCVCQSPVLGGLVVALIRRADRHRGMLVEIHGEAYVGKAGLLTKEGILRRLAHIGIGEATFVRSLGPGMSARLADEYGPGAARKIREVPVRVDLTRFSHVKKDYALDGPPKVVMLGAINGNKGQLRFLTAIAGLLPSIAVWIIGRGPDEQRCREFLGEIGQADRVRFTGQVEHAQLSTLLPKADALVCFSASEATPRAILEGMAAGVPVVSANVGFVSDLFQDDEEGILLGPDPGSEIVTSLQRLLSDETLRARLGRAARKRVERDFEAGAVFAHYRKLIVDTAAGTS